MVTPTKSPRNKTEDLKDYRRKRDFRATPEPGPSETATDGDSNRFVVQEHSATRLHWDLRLERDGVAVSWAVPNGIPELPGENRMAVHTEDHPLEYLSWEGVIPKGNYGAGTMKVWDRGTYETHEWTDTKATVTFHGEQVVGRYHLFHIGGRGGNDWMIRRVDPPTDPDRQPIPEQVAPLIAVPGPLPDDDAGYAFEISWDGRRTLAYCEPGRLRLTDAAGADVTALYPELGRLTRSVGAHTAILDGELIALGDDGRPDRARLERRAKPGTDSAMRRRARDIPILYEIYDLLFIDGHSLTELPWHERREHLAALELDGEHWRVSQHHRGDGAALLEAARANGLECIVAKPVDSPYTPGAWTLVGEARRVELTHPDRAVYPKFTKADVADYYRAVAPVLLPHAAGSGIDSEDALMRWVDADNVELSQRPAYLALAVGSADGALLLHGMFDQLGLESFAKSSGPKRLEVCVPLSGDATSEQTQAFARQIADLVASRSGVDVQPVTETVAPYSLLAGKRPLVATPVTWDEVAAGALEFAPADVVKRVEERGDLIAPLLTLAQSLPR